MSKAQQNLLKQNEETVRRLYVDEQKSCLQVCNELLKQEIHVSTMTVLHFLKTRNWSRSRKERLFDARCQNCQQDFKGGSSSASLCKSCRPPRIAIFKRYGLTKTQYESFLKVQNESCAICLRAFLDETPSVDHCHTTGLIRGLLCSSCNLHLGCVEKLGGFAEYVQNGKNGIVPHPDSEIVKALERFGRCSTSELFRIKCPNSLKGEKGYG